MRWTQLVLLFVLLMVAACTSPATPAPTHTPALTSVPTIVPTATIVPEPKAAWEGRVFYEIFVRSFYDSDGDGIGDFNGITEKLDYLNDGDPSTTDDLGITGIWLMPMMKSDSYHGYDVTDYLRVEPDYGTKADFQRLIEEAHKRGIVVIIDLVLNHTSSKHPWFVQSRDPDSPFRDWYRWESNRNGSGWHQAASGSYYGFFWEGMPDLNYRNPVVTQTMYSASRYWLEEMGVDGFRLDAIKFLYEDGDQIESVPETYSWFVEYNAFLKSIKPDVMTVGEIWSGTPEIVAYVESDGVDFAFEFTVADSILGTARGGGNRASRTIEFALDSFPDQRFATFITNHDQSRVVSQLFKDPQRAKLAATMLLTAPGVPFIYYGEEIGMEGVKPDELIRTPMQWDSAENAAFTTTTPWQPPNETYLERNVANQTDDPDSLLSHYRDLIQLREQYPALDNGAYIPVKANNRKVYAAIRMVDEYAILVIVNGSREPLEGLELDLKASDLDATWSASELRGGMPSEIVLSSNGGFDAYVPFEQIGSLESKLILLKSP